jgi:tetratricopeptide (TPR) repeat protein
MKNYFRIAILFALLITANHTVYAATNAQLEEAQGFLDADNPAKALSLLESSYDVKTASIQEFFLLGIAAKLSEKYSHAETYFSQALKREPNAGRIRLELAEVLFRQGKLDQSREAILTVKSHNPPPQVAKNLDNFLAQIDEAKANPNKLYGNPRKSWSAYITAGVNFDSNVNAGPNTDTVFLYGLPFNLSSNAQETSDTAYFIRAGINHQSQLNRGLLWRSGANIFFNNYSTADSYDTRSLNFSTGPLFIRSVKSSLAFPVTFNLQKYDSQSGWYSQSWGLAPHLSYKLQDNIQLHVGSSLSRKRFKNDRTRDLTAHTFSPSINYQIIQNGNLAFGLNFGHENSKQDIYSNDVLGTYVGYQHFFKEQGIATGITASYTDTKFEGIQRAYTKARNDLSKRISLNVSYLIPGVSGLSLRGDVSYQDNDSNLGINTYDRTNFSISLTKSF